MIQQAGRLQALTQTYQPNYPDYRLNYNPGNCRALAAEVSRKINTPDSRDKLTWLEDQLNQLDLPEPLPKGICHCDFHFSNLLFLDDQFSGLIDFDDANYTYLAFDLVCLIDTWAWPHQSDRIDWTRARKVAQAYIQHRPISPLEVHHLIEVHKLSIFFDCIWFFGRGPAADFYEKRKTEFLDQTGWELYNDRLFG